MQPAASAGAIGSGAKADYVVVAEAGASSSAIRAAIAAAGGTVTEPNPPGWQVPPGERGDGYERADRELGEHEHRHQHIESNAELYDHRHPVGRAHRAEEQAVHQHQVAEREAA